MLPDMYTTLLIVCGVKMIGKEITRIGLEKHYKSHGLINMFAWTWSISMCANFFAVCVVISVL